MFTTTPRPDRITVGQLVVRYLAWCAQHRAPKTREWYAQMLCQWQASGCVSRSTPAREVRGHHVSRWASSGPAKGAKVKSITTTTQRKRIVCVQRLFNWAMREGYLDSNPVQTIELPPPSYTRGLTLTDDQRRDVLAACRSEPVRQFVLALMLTGARPQEVRRVCRRHHDPKRMTWTFPPSEAKNNRLRIVHLPDQVNSLCVELAKTSTDGPLFRLPSGGPWTLNAMRLHFRQLQNRTGIKRLTAYSLRHDYATRLLAAGVSPEVVRVLLGHSSLDMVARHYSHIHERTDLLREALGHLS